MAMQQARAQSGFTLIDVSIMIAVMSVMAVSMLSVDKVGREAEKVRVTNARLDRIELAIKNYYNSTGTLPCPARRDITLNDATTTDDAQYRRVTNCGAAVTSGVVQFGPASDYVRIGVVPTRSLGLPDEAGEDEWNNQFSYAMVAKLGVTGTYSYASALTDGVISVRQNGTSVATTANDVIGYIVFSHGPDGKGGYTTNNSASYACSPTSDAGQDSENCNNDANRIFFDNSIVETRDSTYFYDLVRWKRRF